MKNKINILKKNNLCINQAFLWKLLIVQRLIDTKKQTWKENQTEY